MKGERILYIAAMLLSVLPIGARERQSVEVHEDSTVSFCYCGDAKRVYVQSDLWYANQDSTRYTDRTRHIKMKKQSDGCFHVTTKAVQPETYTYCFRVNGKLQTDSLNADTVWQMKHKWNVVTIGGSEQSKRYMQPTQQGTLIRTTWYSSTENLKRRVLIYLPTGYENGHYPVLYLIHGINGYEGSWSERGRAIQILENLVAEGKCEPMILVMPDVNVEVHEGYQSHYTLWKNICNYGRLCHAQDIERALVELIQMVDTTYLVSDKRYVVGLSDGARIAANTANLLPDYFSAVGLFSPVVHKEQLPKDSEMYYVYTGKKDFFHGNAKRFKRRLEKAKVPHKYTETIGGHTWRNWRLYLSEFLNTISTKDSL